MRLRISVSLDGVTEFAEWRRSASRLPDDEYQLQTFIEKEAWRAFLRARSKLREGAGPVPNKAEVVRPKMNEAKALEDTIACEGTTEKEGE